MKLFSFYSSGFELVQFCTDWDCYALFGMFLHDTINKEYKTVVNLHVNILFFIKFKLLTIQT
jgi:hypothetical protein